MVRAPNSPLSDIVLKLILDFVRRRRYYYVDHTSRCLFWVHPYERPAILSQVEGKKNPSHASMSLFIDRSETMLTFDLIRTGDREPLLVRGLVGHTP